MKRRDAAIALLALGGSPLVCLAQQPGRTYRIGVVLSGPEAAMQRYLVALRERAWSTRCGGAPISWCEC